MNPNPDPNPDPNPNPNPNPYPNPIPNPNPTPNPTPTPTPNPNQELLYDKQKLLENGNKWEASLAANIAAEVVYR